MYGIKTYNRGSSIFDEKESIEDDNNAEKVYAPHRGF